MRPGAGLYKEPRTFTQVPMGCLWPVCVCEFVSVCVWACECVTVWVCVWVDHLYRCKTSYFGRGPPGKTIFSTGSWTTIELYMEYTILGQNQVDVDGTFGLDGHKRSGHWCERSWWLDGRRLGERCLGRVGWQPEAVGFLLLWEPLKTEYQKDSHLFLLGMVWKQVACFFLQKWCSTQLKVRLLRWGKCSKRSWDTAESSKRVQTLQKLHRFLMLFARWKVNSRMRPFVGSPQEKNLYRGEGWTAGLQCQSLIFFTNTSL